MPDFPHLATRIYNTPLAILPGKAEVIISALADRLGVAQMRRAGGQPIALAFGLDDDDYCETMSRDRGYDLVEGVAIICIRGTLVHRLGSLRPYSGMTGYDGIRMAFLAALNDPEVDAIAFDIDSPGGEVSGCFDLADTIYSGRGQKPIWAILGENAYSAAYAIASACDRITVPRTGGTGSIGVIYLHVEMSEALAEAGIVVTLFTYGDRKADGNEYQALPKEAVARFQADVDAVGDLFVATVARNRNLKPAVIQGTQADTYHGSDGVSLGLADAVMAPDAAFRALLTSLG